MPKQHTENFPVASLLCPPALRPAVLALYGFARTADDIADEGSASQSDRLADLAAYEAELRRVHAALPPSGRWAGVFAPLRQAIATHHLPLEPMTDLLSAFRQDCANPRLASRAEVLDYCRRSANPVGRLLLHLYGLGDVPANAQLLRQSDHLCTALQLINFWQDLSVDLPRGRCYIPLADWPEQPAPSAHLAAIPAPAPDRAAALVASLTAWAHQEMQAGAPLALALPGRLGWELRLVVHGGLRVLAKTQRLSAAAFEHRPRLRAWDAPGLLLRALAMRAPPAAKAHAAQEARP